MESIITNARLILLDLVLEKREINIRMLNESLKSDTEILKSSLEFLKRNGLIKYEELNNFELSNLNLTNFGEEVGEEWRNDNRWQLIVRVCKQLDNFSFRTLMKALEKIVDEDMHKHIHRQKDKLKYDQIQNDKMFLLS